MTTLEIVLLSIIGLCLFRGVVRFCKKVGRGVRDGMSEYDSFVETLKAELDLMFSRVKETRDNLGKLDEAERTRFKFILERFDQIARQIADKDGVSRDIAKRVESLQQKQNVLGQTMIGFCDIGTNQANQLRELAGACENLSNSVQLLKSVRKAAKA